MVVIHRAILASIAVIFYLSHLVEITSGGAGGDDGFFFFAFAGGVSAGTVARVMQSKLQNLFGKDYSVRPFEEQEIRPVKCDKQLDCSFKNNTCRWHNVLNDAGPGVIKNVYVGAGKPNATGRGIAKNFLFGTDKFPSAPYGLIAAQQQNVSKIFFCSDPVPFPKPTPGAKGVVKLRHWIMSKSTLKACIRIWDSLNVNNDKDSKKRKWPLNWIGCSQELEYADNAGPTQLSIDLSNSHKSVQSLAKKHGKSKAEVSKVTYEVCLLMGPFPNKQGGIMFIDDISYDAGYCP